MVRKRYLPKKDEPFAADDTVLPPDDSNTLPEWTGFFAALIKRITGEAGYRVAPATTLKAAKAHHDAAAPHLGHATDEELAQGLAGKSDSAHGHAQLHDRLHNLYSSADHADVDASVARANGIGLFFDSVAQKFKATLIADRNLELDRHLPLTVANAASRPATARVGKILHQADTKESLKNTGTEAAPVWSPFGGGGSDFSAKKANLTLSVASSVANATVTNVPYDAETSDPSGWHDPAFPDRISPGAPGLYLVTLFTAWGVNATGQRIQYVNIGGTGAALAGQDTIDAFAGSNLEQTVTYQVDLPAADSYIFTRVYQDSGAALNLLAKARLVVQRIA